MTDTSTSPRPSSDATDQLDVVDQTDLTIEDEGTDEVVVPEDESLTVDDTSTSSEDETTSDESEATGFVATPLFAAAHSYPLTPESSPNGEWLAYFIETAADGIQLWLSPTNGDEPQLVDLPFAPIVERDPDSGRLLRGPQWSPDGVSIALAGIVEGEDRTGIWIIPSPVQSQAVPTLVVSVADEGESSESPAGDGTAAAISTDDAEPVPESDAPAAPQIVSQKVDEVPDFAKPATGDTIEDAAEGVDEIAATADAADTSAETLEEGQVAVLAPPAPPDVDPDAPLRTPHLLTWGPGAERSPRWSPDGNLIAFVSRRDGRDTIALATAVGEEPTIAELLTWSAADDREPVWSRDGRFLAFARQRSDGPEHADILLYSPETGELTNLTEAKASAVRHSLDWVAGRNLVAYVTQDGEWLSISVINADNKAGWAVTRESGDKTEPRFHPTEARLLYIRSEGFATVCCERGLHASGAVALDPSEGVVHAPRWLKDKRVAYGFSAPQKAFGFLAQENLSSSERTPLQIPTVVSTSDVPFRRPVPFEFPIGDDEQFSGMLYAVDEVSTPQPALVYLPDGPLTIRRGDFNLEEQALAQSGLSVFTPLLHGSTGFGKGIENDLHDLAGSEVEVSDIAEAGYGLGESDGIDSEKLALVGVGYGATLALLTAGSRPGVYSAVVAIDPITEWSIELGECSPAWRNWVSRQYGMPLTNPDHYALRTPSTFSSVIDVPVTLVTTAGAPVYRQAQAELLAAWLTAGDVPFEEIGVPDEPLTATLERMGQHLARYYSSEVSASVAETSTEEIVG